MSVDTLAGYVWETAEGQHYLDHFHNLEPERFAIIKVGGELIDNDEHLDLMANDLATLGRLGLYPVVVHGGGDQITKGLEEAGIAYEIVDGLRVTSPEAAALIPGILATVNERLTSRINRDGTIAEGITEGVFSAELSNHEDLGTAINVVTKTDKIMEVIDRDLIPVLSCAGRLTVTEGQETVPININGDIAAVAAGRALVPEKFVFLTSKGAVLDDQKKPISLLNPAEASRLIADGTINHGMGPKVKEAMKLLGHRGVSHIVITSPQALPRELFSDQGDGTLIHAD